MEYCHHCGVGLPEGRDPCPACGADRATILAGASGAGRTKGQAGGERSGTWRWLLAAALGGTILLQVLALSPGISRHFLSLAHRKATVSVPAHRVPAKVRSEVNQAELDGSLPPGVSRSFGDFRVIRSPRTGKVTYLMDGAVLSLEGSASVLVTSPLMLALLALGLVLWARRPVTAALSAGAGLAMLLHWVISLAVVGLPARDALPVDSLSWPLYIKSSGVMVQSDLVIVSLGTIFLSILLAGAAAGTANLLVARFSGRRRCPSCGATFRVQGAAPLYCPACGANLVTGRVRWDLAAPAVLATLIVFYLFVLLVGPTLDFYHHCSGTNLRESCKEGLTLVRQARHHRNSWVTLWWQHDPEHPARSRMMVVHSAKYVLWSAWIFLLGPLFVAWKGKMRGMATAGATIVLSWLGATLIALFFLDFGMFEGSVLISLKIHVAAGVVWALVGLLGAVIGSRLSSNPFEDMDEEAPAAS